MRNDVVLSPHNDVIIYANKPLINMPIIARQINALILDLKFKISLFPLIISILYFVKYLDKNQLLN